MPTSANKTYASADSGSSANARELGGPHGGGPRGTPLRLGTRSRHGRRAPRGRRFTVGGSSKSVARCHRSMLAYWKFESIPLQRRVNKLSVPLEMMLVEGSIRRARTDWPSGGIARRNAHPHYFTYDSPPVTRRRPEGFADAGTCTSQPTARAASQLHLSRRRADSPAPPSRQIKHRKRLAQLHGGISARIHYQRSKRLV